MICLKCAFEDHSNHKEKTNPIIKDAVIGKLENISERLTKGVKLLDEMRKIIDEVKLGRSGMSNKSYMNIENKIDKIFSMIKSN